ncbi:MAG: helix-turn-helix transcriptional regulator [Clostridia bacterium]|nr:helix-turn-helix transcriptional regulator [Clostridia bacterium]
MSFDKRAVQKVISHPDDGGTDEERAHFLKNIPWDLRVIKPRKCIELKTLIYACDKIRPAGYAPNAGAHDFWEFMLVIKGKAAATLDNREYILTDGMMIASPPLRFRGFREIGGQELEFMTVSAEISGKEMEYFEHHNVFTLSASQITAFTAAVSQLHFYYMYMGGEKMLQRGIALFEAFLLQVLMKAEEKNTGETDIRYAEIIEVLNSHIDQKLTVYDISQKCGMSVSLVKKIFSRHSDIGIMAYFNKTKIRRAAELLDRGLNNEETAKKLSFSSTEYFLYCFRREMGMSPKEYLKLK